MASSFKNGKTCNQSNISPGAEWDVSKKAKSIFPPIFSINSEVIPPVFKFHLFINSGKFSYTENPTSLPLNL